MFICDIPEQQNPNQMGEKCLDKKNDFISLHTIQMHKVVSIVTKHNYHHNLILKVACVTFTFHQTHERRKGEWKDFSVPGQSGHRNLLVLSGWSLHTSFHPAPGRILHFFLVFQFYEVTANIELLSLVYNKLGTIG